MLPMHSALAHVELGLKVTHRWQTADYVQRLGLHAREIGQLVVVRCKTADCPIEAIKLFQETVSLSRQCFDILKLCFNCFLVFIVKGTVLRNNVLFCNLLWL
jgi:hypothetical protein